MSPHTLQGSRGESAGPDSFLILLQDDLRLSPRAERTAQ